jgi:hypothetical protein
MLIHVASPNAPREASRLLHVPPFAEINTATSLSLWSSRDINSRDFRVADQSVLICVAQLFGWFAPAVVCYSEFRNVMELGACPAITHQQLGADGPAGDRYAVLLRDRTGELSWRNLWSFSSVSKWMEEEIGRGLCLYVRTSSSTLGPGRPGAVPVLAMDVNPYPDVNRDSVRWYVL